MIDVNRRVDHVNHVNQVIGVSRMNYVDRVRTVLLHMLCGMCIATYCTAGCIINLEPGAVCDY